MYKKLNIFLYASFVLGACAAVTPAPTPTPVPTPTQIRYLRLPRNGIERVGRLPGMMNSMILN